MKQTRYQLLLPLLAVFLVLGLASPAFARGGDDSDNSGPGSVTRADRLNSDDDDTDAAESEDADDDGTHQERTRTRSREERQAERQERVESRRAALKDRIEALKSDRKEKLEGKKLERCEKREDRINSLIDKSVEFSQKRLAVIQKIEARVTEFYDAKDLTANGYDTALAAANEKEAAAVAAVEVMAGQDFSCDEVDSTQPGVVVREIVHARNDALKAYKTAVKDLIVVVKQALGDDSSSSDSDVKPENESEA